MFFAGWRSGSSGRRTRTYNPSVYKSDKANILSHLLSANIAYLSSTGAPFLSFADSFVVLPIATQIVGAFREGSHKSPHRRFGLGFTKKASFNWNPKTTAPQIDPERAHAFYICVAHRPTQTARTAARSMDVILRLLDSQERLRHTVYK
jgi:hypothetical protein